MRDQNGQLTVYASMMKYGGPDEAGHAKTPTGRSPETESMAMQFLALLERDTTAFKIYEDFLSRTLIAKQTSFEQSSVKWYACRREALVSGSRVLLFLLNRAPCTYGSVESEALSRVK